MIVDLTVSNFRSIKDEQTFSLFAEGSRKHLSSNVSFPGDGKVGVLRSAGIYGPNASGKSNLLVAFQALRYIVVGSGDLKDGDAIPCYEPYRLNTKCIGAPISLEVEFFAYKNLRFVYRVLFNEKRIIEESLDYYPSRQKANLFSRKDGDSWEDIYFGNHYKGGRKRYAFFDNNSYLAKAGNSADSPEMIRAIFNFFRKDVFFLYANHEVGMLDWKNDDDLVKSVGDILSKVDSGISGLVFEENDVSSLNLPKNVPENIKKKILESESKKPVFLHKTEDGGMEEFDEDSESSGTNKLFNILPLLIDAFQSGGVLILDELDNSFHPHIAELIIKLFNSPDVNKRGAQLIFSTHNINLMSPELLRRDQIWLTEKNEGRTEFFSLDQFDSSMVKSNSPFYKWYGEGRFGAVPSIDFRAVSSILIERLK
jgi:hypothetical protein